MKYEQHSSGDKSQMTTWKKTGRLPRLVPDPVCLKMTGPDKARELTLTSVYFSSQQCRNREIKEKEN